jgi:(p)ppGpp synthase/HD superfamily hydrolase
VVACYAQTNLQLYHQLSVLGYDAEDIARSARAYEIGIRLFTGVFRGSGKPFLAHLVGTASILAEQRARGPVVAAGLLHAAYASGEFGNGWRGMSRSKRAEVRRAVGGETEDLVAGYTELLWYPSSIADIRGRIGALTPRERDVLLIRLANELEDHLDLGILYQGNADHRVHYMRTHLAACVEMAQGIGYPELANRLAQTFDEVAKAEIPAALQRAEAESFSVPPASHRTRFRILISHFLAGLRGR